MSEGCEFVLVEAFVAKTAIERFNERVLCGLSRLDKVQPNLAIARPARHGDARQFCSIVHYDGLRISSHRADRIKDASDSTAAKRRINLDRKALAGEVVDDIERPDSTTRFKAVVDKVERPTFIESSDNRCRQAAPQGDA
jgi:hypothetical protein